jgi:hypothetical protein
MNATPNIPDVVAEVRALFERFERALVDRNMEMVDATFWNSPHLIRYAEPIHAHRTARAPSPGVNEEHLRLQILTLGRDVATVHLDFLVRGGDRIGRQSQTWVRLPDLGWKIVSAHVSTLPR